MYNTIFSRELSRFLLMAVIVLEAVCADKGGMHAAHDAIKDKHVADGKHNVEFDHEAILGSLEANEEFSKLDPEEAKSRLAEFIKEMDINHDKFITKDEITAWVLHSFKQLDDEEARHKLAEVDDNHDGVITWPEFVNSSYGYTLEELNGLLNQSDPESKRLVEMLKEDEAKFKVADKNKDNKLDEKEYAAFLHPYDYDYMHDFEVSRTMAHYDTNKDGVLNFREFMGDDPKSKEDELAAKTNFDNFDKNHDGKLDAKEVRMWVIPDHKQAAEEEADHLIVETDEDHDGKLTPAEILDKHELWVGSAATDHGHETENYWHEAGEL